MQATHKTQLEQYHEFRFDLDAFGLGIRDGDCFFPVPLRRSPAGWYFGNCTELHAGFILLSHLPVCHEALSGSLEKEKGCLSLHK